ncbi:hypothetical protein CLV56_4068 [Mumia flava]|uniref:Uncharacterized protein n=1 Tax=Mumia flava TaxID=1348852 RepID=A0A0B2BVD1_9ACTN|nr:hypothetical protein [Mumia flava]PJJ48192.1 hypothetical protein CLV56_4068 [Mumia flava]
MGVFRGKGAQEREQVRASGAPRDPGHQAITDLGAFASSIAGDGATGSGWRLATDANDTTDATDASTTNAASTSAADGAPTDEGGADEITDELRSWLRERRRSGDRSGDPAPPRD